MVWNGFLEWDFSGLAVPPCTSQVAAQSPDWVLDDHCPSSTDCPHHPGSDICYRQATAGANGDGNQVCYLGREGGFRINPERRGAGTADRIHTANQGLWASAKHVWYDGIPYGILKETGDLDLYIHHRPNPDPENCFEELPQPAAALGDPHITTFDGFHNTFNGMGEFYFLHALDGALIVQVRMEKVQSDGRDLPATVLTSLVVKSDLSPAVQIGFPTSGREALAVLVDGELQFFDSVLNTQDYEGGVSVYLSPDGTAARVVVSGLLHLDITAANGALAIVSRANVALWNRTSGLLGVFDGDETNDLQLPNGSLVSINATSRQLHYDHGLKWVVQDAAQSLFTYRGVRTFESYQNLSFEPPFLDELLAADDGMLNVTEIALCGGLPECIFDLRLTGSAEFAANTTAQVADFQAVVEIIEEVRLATTVTSSSTSSPSSRASITSTTSSSTSSITSSGTSSSTVSSSSSSSITSSSTSSSSGSTTSSTTSGTVADQEGEDDGEDIFVIVAAAAILCIICPLLCLVKHKFCRQSMPNIIRDPSAVPAERNEPALQVVVHTPAATVTGSGD